MYLSDGGQIFKEDIPLRDRSDWEVITMAREGTALEHALQLTNECAWVSAILVQCCCADPESRSRAVDIFRGNKSYPRPSQVSRENGKDSASSPLFPGPTRGPDTRPLPPGWVSQYHSVFNNWSVSVLCHSIVVRNLTALCDWDAIHNFAGSM